MRYPDCNRVLPPRSSGIFTTIILLTILLIGALLMLMILSRCHRYATTQAPVVAIEKVRALADLVVLETRLRPLQSRHIDGLTGGVEVSILAGVMVRMGVDMNRATLTGDNDHIKIQLPTPKPMFIGIDHRHSRVLAVKRYGLWQIFPGPAGEQQAIERTYRAIEKQAQDPNLYKHLIPPAKRHAQQVIQTHFAHPDRKVTITWRK